MAEKTIEEELKNELEAEEKVAEEQDGFEKETIKELMALVVAIGLSDKKTFFQKKKEVKEKVQSKRSIDGRVVRIIKAEERKLLGRGVKVWNENKQSFDGLTFKEAFARHNQAIEEQAQRVLKQIEELKKDATKTRAQFEKEKYEIEQNAIRKARIRDRAFIRTQRAAAREVIEARRDKKYKIDGWYSVAILDRKTSAICVSLHGKYYSKAEYKTRDSIPNAPPRHINCRSVLIRQEVGTELQVQTADEFLQANEEAGKGILGKKKYAIYKESGKSITSFLREDGASFKPNKEITTK